MQLLSVTETARRLGVSTRLVYELAKRRELRHVRIDSRVLIPEGAIDEFIAERTIATKS